MPDIAPAISLLPLSLRRTAFYAVCPALSYDDCNEPTSDGLEGRPTILSWRTTLIRLNLLSTVAAGLLLLCESGFAGDFKISPAKVVFDRNFEQAQLLVTVCDPAGATNERSEDLTSKAAFAS